MVGPAADDDAQAHPGAHGDVDAAGGPPGAAPEGLPQGGGVYVRVQAHGQTQAVPKEGQNGAAPPARLGRGLDNAVVRAPGVQLQGAEAAHAQGGQALIPEKGQELRDGLLGRAGRDGQPVQNLALGRGRGADHLGPAGLQSAEDRRHGRQLLSFSWILRQYSTESDSLQRENLEFLPPGEPEVSRHASCLAFF